jgi:hypothetical protein
MLTQMQIDMLADIAQQDTEYIMRIYTVATVFGDKDTTDYIAQHYYCKLTPAQQQQIDTLQEEVASAEADAHAAFLFAAAAANDAILRAAAH